MIYDLLYKKSLSTWAIDLDVQDDGDQASDMSDQSKGAF